MIERTPFRIAAAMVVAAGLLVGQASVAQAASFTNTAISMTDSRPSQTANYALTLSGQTTAQSLQCVTIQFNTAADGTGSVPGGFDVSAATWSGNFHGALATWTRAHTTGLAKITGTAQTPPAGTGRTITLTGVTNGNTANTTYYAILKTFSDNTCTTAVDNTTVAFVYTAGTQMTMRIAPSMSFVLANKATACNGETGYIDNSGSGATTLPLGTPAAGAAVSTAQSLTATSNAPTGGGGVTVYLRGLYATGNLRSVSHQLADAAAAPGSSGALGAGERFGFTILDAAGTYDFVSGQFSALDNVSRPVLSQNPSTSSTATGCVGYQVQTATSTPAGDYAATLIYTAVPTF